MVELRCLCFTVPEQHRALEEEHFSGFSRRTDSRSITMKNALYWAMLVGMAVLLMEQGKRWISSSFALVPRISDSVGMEAPVS